MEYGALAICRVGFGAKTLKFGALVLSLTRQACLGERTRESKVSVRAAWRQFHRGSQLGEGLVNVSKSQPQPAAHDVSSKIARRKRNGFAGKFEALLIIRNAEKFESKLDSGRGVGRRNLDLTAELTDRGRRIFFQKEHPIQVVDSGLGRIETHEFPEFVAGGDAILHGNESLSMASAADESIAGSRDLRGQQPGDAESRKPKSID